MPEKDLIIENLKTLRVLENLTVDQLAERLNISRPRLVQYFKRSVPPHDVIRTISETFNIDVHKFYFEKLTEYNYKNFQLANIEPAPESETSDEFEKPLEILLDKQRSQEDKQQAAYTLFKLNEQLKTENIRLRQAYREFLRFLNKHKIINDVSDLLDKF